MRYQAGLFRFSGLLGDAYHDPCTIARAAPPWLAERSFESMDVTVRVANVFVNQQISTVAELARHELSDLLAMQNFGQKSIRDLAASLLHALDGGPPKTAGRAIDGGPFKIGFECEPDSEDGVDISRSLLAGLDETLAGLTDRERDILTRRMGLKRPAETLQAISESHGITRERVRQIESKVVKRAIKEAAWDDLLTAKLHRLLDGREFPLPLLGVEAVDEWFAGCQRAPQPSAIYLQSSVATRSVSFGSMAWTTLAFSNRTNGKKH